MTNDNIIKIIDMKLAIAQKYNKEPMAIVLFVQDYIRMQQTLNRSHRGKTTYALSLYQGKYPIYTAPYAVEPGIVL